MAQQTVEQVNIAEKLPAITQMGAVRLRVKNMEEVLKFYTEGVGLEVLAESEPGHRGEIVLGLKKTLQDGTVEERVILYLEHYPSLRQASRTEAGLFHVAVLFDNKHDLAASLISTLHKYQNRYMGPGDHLVSQAFYFADPEGNGVELYWDRPRDQWQWANGEVVMDTLFIDAAQFVRENLTEEEIVKAATGEGVGELDGKIGHVHLQVGSTKVANDFYVKALGFDKTASLGLQALFVSVGGYHHHMAMNIWNSAGAGKRDKTLGLGLVNLTLPSGESVEQAADRLKFHGIESVTEGKTLSVNDPWNNTLLLTAND